MCFHGSARAERVHSDVFWGKDKSGHSHLLALVPDGGDEVGCTDGAEAVIGGLIAHGIGGIASPVAQAEEDVGACLDWAGYDGLRPEVGYCLTMNGILLVVEGDDNLCGIAEMLNGGVPGEEKVPNEEHEFHKGPELYRLAVAGALRVLVGP